MKTPPESYHDNGMNENTNLGLSIASLRVFPDPILGIDGPVGLHTTCGLEGRTLPPYLTTFRSTPSRSTSISTTSPGWSQPPAFSGPKLQDAP